MYIKDLKINNFRSYNNLEIDFENTINILVGDNAQGKTNLLEAIYFLALGKSLRNYLKDDLIQWNKQYFYLKGSIIEKGNKSIIEIGYNRDNKKIIKINGIEKKNFSDLLGIFNVVIFSPEDLLLIKGSPTLRRSFLDQEISQLFPYYAKLLNQYNKGVINRNRLLKTKKLDLQRTIELFDLQLAKLASEVIKKRLEVLDKVKILASLVHRKLTFNKENLDIVYQSFLNENEIRKLSREELETILLKMYKESMMTDLDNKTTSIGPHRDDLVLYVNGKNVKKFGSQGQQRTTILSLKLAELELFMSHKGNYPVLLLDDVLSELDEKRRKYLISNIKGKVQTFITTTDHDEMIWKEANIFMIENGVVSK